MQLIQSSHAPDTASRQPTETFTGKVHMDPIFNSNAVKTKPGRPDTLPCMGNNVIFTPGARTFWHQHEFGQVLTVTMGRGLICSEGEEPKWLTVGDVVVR